MPQKHDIQILNVSFLGCRTPSRQGQGQGQDQDQERRRGAAQQLKLALTLDLAAGGVTKPDMTHRGFENRTF